MAESPFTLFDLCAGTGMLGVGVKLALEAIGIRAVTVGGCEREAGAAASFLAGLENEGSGGVPVWDDATTLFGRRRRGLERVDAICAGYPCQPFSHAGRRDGSRDDRHLWPAVRRIVARLEPELVFFENVDGHVSLGLWKVLRDLERLGYRVTCGVFSAEEVGAPHLRKRLFILGLADAEHQQRAESGVHSRPGPSGQREAGIVRRSESVGDAESGKWRGRGIFPPRQSDYAAWARLAAGGLDPSLMPAIESGVSVVADGMAPPADLLRLGGNGVCPLQAAWALLSLFACLMDRVENESDFGPLFAD